jgi:hypothetical protein
LDVSAPVDMTAIYFWERDDRDRNVGFADISIPIILFFTQLTRHVD